MNLAKILEYSASFFPDRPAVLDADREISYDALNRETNQIATALTDCGRFDEASDYFEKAQRLDPENALAQKNFGIALAGRGRLDEAIAHFQKVLEINPADLEVRNRLGNALAGRGRFDEAIAQFHKVLELRSDQAEAYNNLGVAFARQQRFGEAMGAVDKALELNPEYIEAYNIRGMIYNEQGQYLKAMESFRRLLESPSYGKPWVAYYNLGFAAASAGNQEEALFYYSRALEQKDDYVQARYQRGLMLERLDRGFQQAARFSADAAHELKRP